MKAGNNQVQDIIWSGNADTNGLTKKLQRLTKTAKLEKIQTMCPVLTCSVVYSTYSV